MVELCTVNLEARSLSRLQILATLFCFTSTSGSCPGGWPMLHSQIRTLHFHSRILLLAVIEGDDVFTPSTICLGDMFLLLFSGMLPKDLFNQSDLHMLSKTSILFQGNGAMLDQLQRHTLFRSRLV